MSFGNTCYSVATEERKAGQQRQPVPEELMITHQHHTRSSDLQDVLARNPLSVLVEVPSCAEGAFIPEGGTCTPLCQDFHEPHPVTELVCDEVTESARACGYSSVSRNRYSFFSVWLHKFGFQSSLYPCTYVYFEYFLVQFKLRIQYLMVFWPGTRSPCFFRSSVRASPSAATTSRSSSG